MSSPQVELYRGKIFGVLFVVFLCGMAAGAVGMKVYVTELTPVADNAHDLKSALAHLSEELDLDSQQVIQVRSVLDECIMEEAELMEQIRTLRAGGRLRIEKILNESQKKKFETLLHEVASGE
jgi:hypothetical protein